MKRYSMLILLLLFAQFAMAQDAALSLEFVGLPENAILQQGMTIELSAQSAADDPVVDVELFINDQSAGKSIAAPYTFEIENVSGDSVHWLRAVATTKSGKMAIATRLLQKNATASYSVEVNLINLYVTVTNADGNYLRDLTELDFEVLEDRVPQKIKYFTSEITPLSAAILMDISSSMLGNRIIRAQNAAIELVEQVLRPDDQFMVLGFDDKLYLYQQLSNVYDEIVAAIRMTRPDGGTALWDAVAGTTRRLISLKGKRAIVLLSDGDDTNSEFRADEVLAYLQSSGVLVYTVGLQTLTVAQTVESETERTIQVLKNMADFSGGKAYFPSYISHLPDVYAAIGKDLNSQYTLGYYPIRGGKDGSWRKVIVRVKGRPELTVRHRNGYFAR